MEPTYTFTPEPTACLSNAVANPGFEYWNDFGPLGPPDSWSLETTGFTAAQESVLVYEGNHSAKLTWTSTTTQEFTQFVPVVEGETYDLSMYYYDNDTNGQIRLYCYWLNSGGTVIGSAISSPYSADNAAWFKFEVLDLVAPVGAVTFEFCVRMYDISGWIGTATVYVDKAELCGMIPASPTPTTIPTEPPTPEPTATDTPQATATFTPEPTMTFTPEPTATGTPAACLHDGDVNGDGGVTPGDAQMTFQLYLSCAAMNPTIEQYCAADFCGSGMITPCDGSVTPADAQGIMRAYLGYATPCMKRAAAGTGNRSLTLRQIPGSEPGTVTVSVGLTGSGEPVSAFGIALRCGTAGAKLVSSNAGALNPGWTMFKCVAAESSIIRIGALSVADNVGPGQQGSLAELTFSLPADCAKIDLSLMSVEDDLAGLTIK